MFVRYRRFSNHLDWQLTRSRGRVRQWRESWIANGLLLLTPLWLVLLTKVIDWWMGWR